MPSVPLHRPHRPLSAGRQSHLETAEPPARTARTAPAESLKQLVYRSHGPARCRWARWKTRSVERRSLAGRNMTCTRVHNPAWLRMSASVRESQLLDIADTSSAFGFMRNTWGAVDDATCHQAPPKLG